MDGIEGMLGKGRTPQKPLVMLGEELPGPDVGQLEEGFLSTASLSPGTQNHQDPAALMIPKELPGKAGGGQGSAIRLTIGLLEACSMHISSMRIWLWH